MMECSPSFRLAHEQSPGGERSWLIVGDHARGLEIKLLQVSCLCHHVCAAVLTVPSCSGCLNKP